MIFILPTTSVASELTCQKILYLLWGQSPITVSIDSKSRPPDYNATYYIQIIKDLQYWEKVEIVENEYKKGKTFKLLKIRIFGLAAIYPHKNIPTILTTPNMQALYTCFILRLGKVFSY